MLPAIRPSVAIRACAALLVLAAAAGADDKKADKNTLSGTWARKGAEMKVEFDKDTLKLSPHGDKDVIVVTCTYSVGKDGLIKAKITALDGKAKDLAKQILPEGLEFSFSWKATKDAATIEDVKGDNIEMLRSHLEGEYEKK